MDRIGARALPLVGLLCLAGQGVLLHAGSRAADAPRLPWPGLFLLLTVGAAVALAVTGRSNAGQAPRERLLWRAGSLLAVAVLLGTALGFNLVSGRPAGPAPDHSTALDRATARALSIAPSLASWWADGSPARGLVSGAAPDPADSSATLPPRGGDVFRRLAPWPQAWRAAGLELPAGAVLWSEGERLAWVGEVAPLPRFQPRAGLPVSPHWARTLRRGREGWILQQATSMPGGEVLELQVWLAATGQNELAPGVELVVGPVDDPALSMDDSGLLITQIGFGPDGGAPFAHLLARPESPAVRRGAHRARLLLAALLAWAVAGAGLARLAFGTGAMVAALVVGRSVLAWAEALRWVGAALPDTVFPVAPGSWLSLVDPAYFATPFAGGWFASAADALYSAVIVAVVAWYTLRRRGLIGGTAGDAAPPARALLGPHPVGGLGFGIITGGMLAGLGFVARLLAENANPRLIGTAISLDAIAFWGLQIVLTLLALAGVGFVVALVAGGRWPSAADRPGWLGGGVLAVIAAVTVATFTARLAGGTPWWASELTAAALVAGTWFLAPTMRTRPHFLRRFTWPVLLLLAVAWNYTALRDVYDAAERAWLENQGSTMTVSDTEWSRLLLGTVLDDMVAADRRAGSTTGENLWRDEAAWRLYRGSALADLGRVCAVELIDTSDREESYFALGFMNTAAYEVVWRGPWVDMSGNAADAQTALMFRSEWRRYPGGDEEVLSAETRRAEDRGWLRIDLPVRSWRVATLSESLAGDASARLGRYRPRTEVNRPVVLMLADDTGWIDTGPIGMPEPAADEAVAELRHGDRDWAVIRAGDEDWLCLWRPLPAASARSDGEGFLLGLRRARLRDDILDMSRLMLLNLVLFFLFFVAVQTWRRLFGPDPAAASWRLGFQERFLAGYLLLGLVLLVLVGMSVDQVGYERVRAEARSRTRAGLALAVEQLRALLTEQARSLVDSEYIDDLMRGRLAGQRPLGSEDIRQGMVFAADGALLLDETLSDLSATEALGLLEAARTSPMVVIRDDRDIFIGVLIPIDLRDWVAVPETDAEGVGHGQVNTNGFFFYRQQLDKGLVRGLAELVGGQLTIDVAGQPVLASHPAAVFAGTVPLLADPDEMIPVLDHRAGASVFAAPGRPFAFTAGRPLTALSRAADDAPLRVDAQPAVLNLAFPDREVEYANQRNATVLFLAGLANLILLTALLMALLLSWNIFRPVRLLLTATRSLAQGDFDAPLPDAGRDEVGRLAGAFGSMRSELQTARDDLAARERFLATVLARVTVGVAVFGEDGEVVELNPTGAQILVDFLPGVTDRAAAAILLQRFRDLAPGHERVTGEMVSADGKRNVRGALAPLELPGGRTDTMLVFEDITEFLATKKMALNAELTRQVAHEIKNPLTPIQLSVQLLSQAWRDKHPQLERIVPETVERVLQQVELLRSIASEFSLLGRPGELETEAVDLLDMVRSVAAAYAPGAADHILRADARPLPPVQAHRDSLRKILGNLMQNSLDAARPEIDLEVAVEWRIGARDLTLVWRDNGSGLPAEVADRLFDPYFSTKSKGTGLGLVICRNLADRMGGTITLGNRDDGPGAVAELTLPRSSHDKEGHQG